MGLMLLVGDDRRECIGLGSTMRLVVSSGWHTRHEGTGKGYHSDCLLAAVDPRRARVPVHVCSVADENRTVRDLSGAEMGSDPHMDRRAPAAASCLLAVLESQDGQALAGC